MTKNKIIPLLTGIAGLLVGAACAVAVPATATSGSEPEGTLIPLPDGSSVMCVVLNPPGSSKGALSCNWPR
jgi:hypothetical protein